MKFLGDLPVSLQSWILIPEGKMHHPRVHWMLQGLRAREYPEGEGIPHAYVIKVILHEALAEVRGLLRPRTMEYPPQGSW